MVVNISVNIKIAVMVKVYTPFPIKIATWVLGNKINLQVKVYMSMQVENAITVNSSTARNMEEEPTIIKVEPFMMENGIKIVNMVLVSIPTQMARNIKVTG